MKKRYLFIISILFIFSINSQAFSTSFNTLTSSKENNAPILIELFTNYENNDASIISEQLYRYFADQYPYSQEDGEFYYLTMITDLNEKISQRAEQLGITTFPSVVIDGGYQIIENVPSDMNSYKEAVSDAKHQDKADLEIFLESTWTSSPCYPQVMINIEIYNNEKKDYEGHLVVYFAEIETDIISYTNRPFDFVFEDYAENKMITVQSGPTDKYVQEITYFPDSPGCLRFHAPNYIVIASVVSKETGYVDCIQAARLVTGIQPYQPEKPRGQNHVKPGQEYFYKTSSTDLNEDFIKYAWDWNGDYKADEYTALYPSGSEIEQNHSWEQKGTYNIMVKAIDEEGFSSFWSDPLSISTAKYKESIFQKFMNFLQSFINMYTA